MNTRQPNIAAAQPFTIGESFRKAVELLNAGRLAEARAVCQTIVAVKPNSPDAQRILGAIAYQERDSAAAITHFQRALKLEPEDLETRLNLAKAYRDFEKWPEAAKTFETVLKRTPDSSETLYDLGKAYSHLGRHIDAVTCYQRALINTLAPDIVETTLASELLKLHAIVDAERHYGSVLARSPRFIPALINRAVLCDIKGEMDEALSLFETALRYDPDSVDAHFHRALALISRERLAEGWEEYVWRFKRPKTTTLHDRFQAPYWNGEPLEGRTLLAWTEQGLGDEILLSSMIPDVLARGARCTLVCTERLKSLFQTAFPDVRILTREDMKVDIAPVGHIDFQASLSQLGRFLRPSITSFPQRKSYLKTDPAHVAQFRDRYRQGSSDKLVGIAWESANPQAGEEKSTPLSSWAEILRTPGYRFVSLQYGDQDRAYKNLRKETGLSLMVDDSLDPKKDIDRFAAQVAAMDLVISVSNTTVHFAGALGVPVWTLVPASVGRIWYWFLGRTDSPWYPSMRLFRQERGVDWQPTLDAVAEELKQRS